jgi:hypothetical protein
MGNVGILSQMWRISNKQGQEMSKITSARTSNQHMLRTACSLFALDTFVVKRCGEEWLAVVRLKEYSHFRRFMCLSYFFEVLNTFCF